MSKLDAKTILIIEDEQAISKLCDRILTEEGYKVEVCTNAEYAQKLVADNQYDLILTDIRLPEMNGIQFYQWLQTDYPEMTDHVAIMTGSVIGGNTIKFLTESGRPHLYKPFGSDELKVFIAGALKQTKKAAK